MPYIGNNHIAGDHTNNFKVLDDISSYTATFDGSATSVVDTTNNTIRVVEHRFIQGQRVTYTNGGGGNIGGLTTGTAYFVIFDSASTFKLATSASNAANSTAINLSAVGTGSSHTINAAFDGVNTKFKLTHSTGTGARLNNATQVNVAINNVLQKPNQSASYTEGFIIEDNHKIAFKTAPTSEDIFWGSIIANTLTTFDISHHKIDTFTGDGSTTEFTLSHTPANNESLMVTINGVLQHPSNASTARAYTLIASIIQFTAAPGVGDEIQVRHMGFAGATTADVSGFYGRTGNVVLTSNDHITTGNINAGIVTATSFDGTFSSSVGGSNANFTGIVTAGTFKGGNIDAVDGAFSGNVTIGGTLTYEDVTNIDSVGIITAQSDMHVGAGLSVAGIGTFNTDTHIGRFLVHKGDTTTHLGFDVPNNIEFTAGNAERLRITNTGNVHFAGDQSGVNRGIIYNGPGYFGLFGSSSGSTKREIRFHSSSSGSDETLRISTGGNVAIYKDLDVDGHTNLDNVSIAGVTTASGTTYLTDIISTGSIDLSGDIDVDGHTNLDNVSIAGIATGTIFKVPDATNASGATNHIAIGDNSDLKLYHDNSGDAYITNDTGHLTIRNDTSGKVINLQPKSGANGVIARYEGAVELYHNNNLRVQTDTSSTIFRGGAGIRVYGDVGSNQNGQISIHPTGSAVYSNLYFYNEAGNAYASIIGHAGQTLFFTGGTNGPLRHRVNGTGFHSFQEGNTQRVTITAGGSVNIGSDFTQTTYKLKVTGTSYLGGVVRVPNGSAAAPSIHFGDSDTGLYGDASNGVRLTAGGSDKIVATTNGVTFPIKATALTSFTLGSQSALSKPLYFADAASVESASILLDNSSQELRIKNGRFSGQITFTTYNAERLRITSGGDVGISSTAPRAKLDVKDQGTSKDVILRVSADDNNPYALVVGNDTFNTDSNNGLAMWVGSSKIHHIAARTSETNSENKLEIEAYETTIQTGSSYNQNSVFDSNGRLLMQGAAASNAFSGGDDLIIGSTSARSGITLVSATGNDGGLYFSKGTSSNNDHVMGQIVFQHDGDGGYFRHYTNASERLRIAANGDIALRNSTNTHQEIQWYVNNTKSASIGWGNGSANWQFKHFRNDNQADNPYANIDFFTGDFSNPTRALRITNDGNHIREKHSRFATRIEYSTSNEAVDATLDFKTAHVNVGNDFDAGNNYYVAPVDGDYAFWFHTNVAKSGSGAYYVSWHKNGTEVNGDAGGRIYDQHSGAGWHNLSGCIMLSLDEGDQITIRNRVEANFDGNSYGQFMGWLVG